MIIYVHEKTYGGAGEKGVFGSVTQGAPSLPHVKKNIYLYYFPKFRTSVSREVFKSKHILTSYPPSPLCKSLLRAGAG